jgi:hypothetical protein
LFYITVGCLLYLSSIIDPSISFFFQSENELE